MQELCMRCKRHVYHYVQGERLVQKKKKNEHIRYKQKDKLKRETYGERDKYGERFAYTQEI